MTKNRMSNEPIINNEIIFYTSPEGDKKIEVFYQDESFWLTQKQLAELFGVEINTVNYHLKEIFKSEELIEDSVIRKIRITAGDGKIGTPPSSSDFQTLIVQPQGAPLQKVGKRNEQSFKISEL